MQTQRIVDHFQIDANLAKELSDLLVRQSIRERVLTQVADDPAKFSKMEESLIPIVSRIEAIKNIITEKYVPEEYRSEKFMWNYNGMEISGNTVDVLELVDSQ